MDNTPLLFYLGTEALHFKSQNCFYLFLEHTIRTKPPLCDMNSSKMVSPIDFNQRVSKHTDVLLNHGVGV